MIRVRCVGEGSEKTTELEDCDLLQPASGVSIEYVAVNHRGVHDDITIVLDAPSSDFLVLEEQGSSKHIYIRWATSEELIERMAPKPPDTIAPVVERWDDEEVAWAQRLIEAEEEIGLT